MKTEKSYFIALIALSIALLTTACTKTIVEKVEMENSGNGAGHEIMLSSDDERYTVDNGGIPHIGFYTSGGTVMLQARTYHVSDYFSTSPEEWIETSSDSKSGQISVSVQENPDKGDRNGRVVITAVSSDGDSTLVTVMVKQNGTGTPELRLDAPSCTFPPSEDYGESVIIVPVHTNQDEWWFENDTNDWLNIEKTEEGLRLTALPNSTLSYRETEIRVTAGIGEKSITRTLTVRQDAVSYISVSDSFSISYDAVSTRIPIASNYDWHATSDASWISATEDKDGNLLLSSETNRSSTESRRAVIRITAGPAENNTATAEIAVIQYGYNPSALVFETVTFYAGTTIYLPITGDVNCTVDWGDGTVEKVTSEFPSHEYATADFHTASVTGTVTEINSSELPSFSYQYITGVAQWGKTGLKSMHRAFYGCLNLRFIAGDTEGSFADVTTFEEAFYGCERLQTLPETLFSHARKATSFYGTFQECPLIPLIPERLFENTVAADIFRYTFYGCTSVKEIPASLFANCTNATSFYGTFQRCTGLTAIPGELFSNNTSVTSFGYVFNGCTGIETLPENLFSSCRNATTFTSAFSNCTSLKTVPTGIFDMNKSVRIWSSTFNNCTALTGESPYTEVDGVKVHLYEREDYPDIFATPTTTERCFANATGLSDYQDIPAKWL